jgi:ABC-type dipeptide/oligopeptide/nickel transport system permease component
VAPYDPSQQFFDGLTLEGAPLPPSARFWLGTDLLGRDLLSRLIFGARTSLMIGVAANTAAVALGALVGVIAGYLQGPVGFTLMRLTDLMIAFPALLLAIALAAIFAPSLWIVAMVIALVNWVQVARIVYTETRGLAARDYIEATRALGAAWPRVVFRHILPHLMPTLLVWGTLGIATPAAARPPSPFRHRRPPAHPLLGRDHLREPVLFPDRALAGLLSGCGDPAAGAVLQSGPRCAARRLRSHRAWSRRMIGYLSRRLAASALILIGVTMVTFALAFLMPADPVRQIAGRNASPQTVESIRHQLGLDRPVPMQYATYLGHLAQGDLGHSYIQKTDVGELIMSRLPATLLLMLGAIFFELAIGIPLGTFAAARRGKADRAIMIFAFAGVSTPQFVVGLVLLYLLAYLAGWFPMSGYGGLSHLILPALTLGIGGGGWYARILRSSLVEVLRQDYIRTARARASRADHRHHPCAAQRSSAHRGHDRPRYRHLHGRGGGGQSVYGWPASASSPAGDPAHRYPHHHGRHPRRRRGHRARQSHRRSGDAPD